MKKIFIWSFALALLAGGVFSLAAQDCVGGVCTVAGGKTVSGGDSSSLPVLTSQSYASMKKDQVFVVMFSAAYCRPCREAKQQMFPELMNKYAKYGNVHFFTLDVEKDVAGPGGVFLKDAWAVSALPTFVVVYNDSVMLSLRGYSADSRAATQQAIENKINALR